MVRAGGSPAGVPVTFTKFYIEELRCLQISIKVTMQMEEQCDEKALQPFHPTHSLGAFAHLVAAPLSVTITLDQMLIENVFESGDDLLNRIGQHYEQSIKYQLLKVIGSRVIGMELLGNPLEIFADVSGGVRQFFQEQRKGVIIKSPKGFAQSLGSVSATTAGGMGQLAFRFTSGLTKELAYDFAWLARDEKYMYERQMAAQKEARSMRQGIYLGGQLFRAGVYSGVTGVVRQPIRGAREAGAKGFVQGVGKGTIGLIAKPASGAAAMISKTAEGAASEVKQLTSGKSEVMLRVRQPRELRGSGTGTDSGVLLPYPRCFTMDL